MAKKKKQKKIKRELEKFQRTGRHWDWLKAMENEPLTHEKQKEKESICRDLVGKAVQSPEAFQEFCRQTAALAAPPSFPDVSFLLALRDFLEGTGTEASFPPKADLSPPVQALYRKAQSLTNNDGPHEKISTLLGRFVKQPEKISRRHYQDMAGLLTKMGMAIPVQALGEKIGDFRKLNYKAVLTGSLKKVNSINLRIADQSVASTCKHLPSSLARVLCLPICTQVALFLKNCRQRPHTDWLAGFLSRLEYLAPHVVGEKAEQVLQNLALEHPDALELQDAFAIKKTFDFAGLEEKLKILIKVRKSLQITSSRQHRDFLLPKGMDSEHTDELDKLLTHFYENILGELATAKHSLTGRDRKALARIIDPMLSRDMDIMYGDEGDSESLSRLLAQAAAAGCMGKRLALLGVTLDRWDKTRQLRVVNEEIFPDLSFPEKQDLDWLVKNWGDYLTLSSRAMAAILSKLQPDQELTGYFVYGLWGHFIREYSELNIGDNPFSSMLMDRDSQQHTREVLSRKMREVRLLYNDFPQLHILREFLTTFPNGRLHSDGLKKWYEITWSDPSLARYFDETVMVATSPFMNEASSGIDVLFNLFKPAYGKSEHPMAALLLQFFKDHHEDFHKLPPKRLEDIMNMIFDIFDKARHDGTLVTRLFNAVSARVDSGETELEWIRDELMKHIKTKAQPIKKTWKKR